ncbi:MAG: c-type cytochrome biogenesis protein CcsB [Proteobacteria bacterium]|nr:c-type cytochrome biogenesis protein CcsB [Pseudomonadota bacterium]MBU4384246.1 c-type cytochrome biogenesis protein CcsB [Pseudomonadota bacterium]MBU4606208.1 c-type cytochrome biogenesis protein CcsB [Pseudomonadota bacterium]MCG2766705.1 c-type cytochrome biogenesis protein CcsB [Desulfarculaceae bacterium]
MEALSNQILVAVTFTFLAASVLYLCHWAFKSKVFGWAASGVTWAALGVLTLAIILRWVASHQMGIGHAPFSNLFESLVFFAWTIAAIYLIIELSTWMRTIGSFAVPLAFLSMLYALTLDPAIKPLLPALKSNWLIAHVITCFLGYAGFAVSAALGAMYLATGQAKDPASPRALVLDNLIYQTVVVGFILLTAGIVTGSIWANSAWGTYWSWDPKETWSLITWLVYASLLHSRFMRGWQGKRMAVFSLVGFGCVLFTYFGVNLLLSGLHSYATGK